MPCLVSFSPLMPYRPPSITWALGKAKGDSFAHPPVCVYSVEGSRELAPLLARSSAPEDRQVQGSSSACRTAHPPCWLLCPAPWSWHFSFPSDPNHLFLFLTDDLRNSRCGWPLLGALVWWLAPLQFLFRYYENTIFSYEFSLLCLHLRDIQSLAGRDGYENCPLPV